MLRSTNINSFFQLKNISINETKETDKKSNEANKKLYLNLFKNLYSLNPESSLKIISDFINYYSSNLKKSKNENLSICNFFESVEFGTCFEIESINLIEDCFCDFPSELIFVDKAKHKTLLLTIILAFMNTNENENLNQNKDKILFELFYMLGLHSDQFNYDGQELNSNTIISLSPEQVSSIILLAFLLLRSYIFIKGLYKFLPLHIWLNPIFISDNYNLDSCLNPLNLDKLDKSFLNQTFYIDEVVDEFTFSKSFEFWQHQMLTKYEDKFTIQNLYYNILSYIFPNEDFNRLVTLTSIFVSIEELTKLNKDQYEIISSVKIKNLPDFITRLMNLCDLNNFENIFFSYAM